MESTLKVGIVGYTDIFDSYTRALERLENASLEGIWCDTEDQKPEYDGGVFESFTELIGAVDAVIFLGEKVRKKLINDAIRSLKHVFVDDYSAIIFGDIEGAQRLVEEARVVAQVSMPKMYYWNISEITQSYKNVRHIQFIKEQVHTNNRFQADYIPELMAILKLVNEDVLRAHNQNIPLLYKKVEQVEARLDFTNGVTASISSNPCGFADRQELRLITDKAIAMLDLRKREHHRLVKGANKELQKELVSMEEVPFIELTELENFVESIREKTEPMVSFNSMRRLHRCLQLMEENR